MTTITATASGGTRNWSDTATWSPAQVPTAADDVVLASTSGNVTIDATANCRSLDCQASGNYAGTLSHAAGVNLAIGDATAGAGNRILRLSPSMTVSSNGNAWNLNSTSATQQTVTSAGKSINWLTLTGGASSSYLLADALTVTVSLVHNIGTFNTGNQAVTCGSFVSNNSNTRTLTLGSSTITLTATTGNAWTTTTTTGLTVTANTATLALAGGVAGGGLTVDLGSFNWNGLSINYTGAGTCYLVGAATVANFTRTGTAAKTNYLRLYNNLTVTGTFTVASNSDANPVLVHGDTLGMPRTITAANVVLTNRVDFMDVAGAGAGSWTGSKVGDAGGNSGITFTASVTRYGVVAGNWSSTATWSATSGGAGGASVPLPQDDVILDASSAAGTYTVDMPRACRNLTCTGFTRTLLRSIDTYIFGSYALGSGMTLTGNQAAILYLRGRGSHTMTHSGRAWAGTVQSDVGTYAMQDAFAALGTLYALGGTFTTNGYNVTALSFTHSGGAVVNAGATVWTLTGSEATVGAPVWRALNGTWTQSGGTIAFTDTSASLKTFGGLSRAYGIFTILGGASNSVAVTGANTFDRINAPAGCVLTFPPSVTQAFTGPGIVSTGAPRRGIRFSSSGSGYVSTPDEAGLTPASSLSARFAWALDDWTPAVGAYLGSHYTSSPNKAWLVAITTAGLINFVGSSDGTNVSSITSTVAPTLTDGAAYCIRADWATSGTVTFSTKPYISQADMALDTGWTQTGTPVASGLATLANAAVAFQIAGHSLGSSLPTGEAFGALLRVDGNVVVNVDLTAKPFGADSFVCATGQTVTVNGDLAKAGDGRVLLNSATLGTTATISKSGGQMVLPFTTVKDITFSGGAAFIAPPPSVLVSNTSGIRNGARYGISADGTQFFKY